MLASAPVANWGCRKLYSARVVALPAVTERAGHLALVLSIEQRLEVGEGVAFSVDAQGVLDGVSGRVDPFLVATVGVVGDLEGAVPRGDGVGLRPQFLGLVGVVAQDVVAGQVLGVALKGGGGEVLGGGCGVFE